MNEVLFSMYLQNKYTCKIFFSHIGLRKKSMNIYIGIKGILFQYFMNIYGRIH